MRSLTSILAPPDGAFRRPPKPPTEYHVVSTACRDAAQLRARGVGDTAFGTLPVDGCTRVVPDSRGGIATQAIEVAIQ